MNKQNRSQSIRLIVHPRLKEQVREKARELGVNMSTYIKHLILVDIQKLPVYEPSERVKKALKESLKERHIKTGNRNPIQVLDELARK